MGNCFNQNEDDQNVNKINRTINNDLNDEKNNLNFYNDNLLEIEDNKENDLIHKKPKNYKHLSSSLNEINKNLNSLNINIINLEKKIEGTKNNNNSFNGFPIYNNDYILNEMKNKYIKNEKKKFKAQIKNEIKNQLIKPILDSLKKKDEEISDLKSENNTLTSEITKLNEQIVKNNNQLKNQISNEAEKINKQIENVKKNLIEYINSKIENLQKQYNNEIININKIIENNKNKNIIEIENLQKEFTINIENLKNKINLDLEKEQKKNNSKFQNLEKSINENKTEIGTLSKRHDLNIELLKKEIEKINKENLNLKNNDIKIENELKNINDKNKKTEQKLEKIKEEIKLVSNEISKKNIINFARDLNKNLRKNVILNKQKSTNKLKLELFSKKNYGIVGLNNIGNNCYINSVLQILKNIPIFTYNICNLKNPEKFLYSFKELLINICDSKNHSFSPEKFKTNLGIENKLFSGYNQYDSTIFYVALLNIINKKLSKPNKNYKRIDMKKHQNKSLKEKFKLWKENYLTKNQTFIFNIFYTFYVNEVVCNNCHDKAQTFQSANFLDFPIITEKGCINSLLECFENYQNIKILHDKCDKCHNSELNQQLIILELPPVLIINLKRVGESSAYFNEIDIPHQLDMEKIIKNIKINSIYELRGFIKHSGNENSGHNYAFCKNMFDEKWYEYNDSRCSLIDNEPELNKIFFLCYIKVGCEDESIEYLKKIIESFNEDK